MMMIEISCPLSQHGQVAEQFAVRTKRAAVIPVVEVGDPARINETAMDRGEGELDVKTAKPANGRIVASAVFAWIWLNLGARVGRSRPA